MPLLTQEEEKKQEAPREEVEYIDTSSNPQPTSAQQPAEVRPTGLRKILIAEESKTEAFMTAKVDNPEARRIQMSEQMRKDNRREKISKKRQNLASNHREVEEFGPFPESTISDFDHCVEFLAEHPEVTEEQYMDLFESSRREHPG